MILIDKELKRVIRKARRLSKNDSREVCGFLVHNGHFIELIEAKNESKRMGNFKIGRKQYKRIKAAVKILKHEFVGTFHSHPAYYAEPGNGDIKGAVDNSLMLIIDCIGNEAKLWRIKNGKAREVKYKTIEV